MENFETIEIKLKNPTDFGSEDAMIQFVPNRGLIKIENTDKYDIVKLSAFSFYVRFKDEKNLDSGEEINIKVDYIGEVPTILTGENFINKAAYGRELAERMEKKLPIFKDVDRILENFLDRRSLVRKIWGKEKTAQKFFFELDSQTFPPLYRFILPMEEMAFRNGILLSGEIMDAFKRNIKDRGHTYYRAVINHTTNFIPELSMKFNQESLDYLNILQKTIIDKYFVKDGIFDIDSFTEAFVWFVNGDLRSKNPYKPGTSAEPDSAHYFFFAEWAILSIENNREVDFWKSILHVFVLTQKIYIRVYYPSKICNYEEILIRDYSIDNFDERRKYKPREIRNLIETYKKMDYYELRKQIGENCWKAFPRETQYLM